VASLRTKIKKSALLRLQHELDQALAEEDYTRAAKTQQELQREHRHTAKPSAEQELNPQLNQRKRFHFVFQIYSV
jgi:hypothetical protein